jgi:uncharacterized protein YutE (UPF0331/DUF86 family)
VIDAAKLENNLRNLDKYLGYLNALASLPRATLLADFTKTGSVRYYLQVAIECCLDAANHIIAAQSLRPPADYADAFAVLGEAGIVPADFVPTLQQMARLRNRLVHLYWEVDDDVLYQILTTELGDFDRFKACVLALLPGARPSP